MIILLAAITLVFTVSLYFIFIKPQDNAQLVTSNHETSIEIPPGIEKKSFSQLYKHLVSVIGQVEDLQAKISAIKKDRDEKINELLSKFQFFFVAISLI